MCSSARYLDLQQVTQRATFKSGHQHADRTLVRDNERRSVAIADNRPDEVIKSRAH
jgi:hypothetical protein